MGAIFQTKITYTGVVGMRPSTFRRRFLKPMYHFLGEYWHRELLPKHFTNQGAKEYGYAPRKGEKGNKGGKGFRKSYTGRKLKRFGHTRPLVFTGELQRMSRFRNIKATSKGVKVTLPQARKANLRHPKSNVNMADELTRFSDRDIAKIHDQGNRFLRRKFRSEGISERRVKTIR